MVAFLKKPQGIEDFHQIVDFLKASHIGYALFENPTIYVSLINQFWCTASARTLNNGEIDLNAIVDGHDKTITKVSVRRHLKLANAKGINTLPTTKFFEQLALMGPSSLSPVNKLEKKLKHKRRRAVIHSSEDEEASLDHEDSPKQGRMIEEIDKDKNVNLVQSSEQREAYETAEHRMDFSTTFPQTDDEETLAETLLNIKRSASKDKGGYTLKQRKQYSFEEIKMLFDNTIESIRRFVPMESEGQATDSKAGEGSSKKGDMKIMFKPDGDAEV
nr:hypothetical protein [Tanacetum cinerariifolium]